jgi:MinD-like ATPase involved in chromosome partitioning or flagellar assembly
MYVVGFYSPREKSGVTKMSLAVYQYLKENASIPVTFVSNGRHDESPKDYEVHEFAELSLEEQKEKIKELKENFKIVIYDASSGLNEETLKLLPIADRLFIVGEDDTEFASTLFSVINFNKSFDPKSRDLTRDIHNTSAFVLENEKDKIGFFKSNREISEISKIILNDYSVFFLHRQYTLKYEQIITQLIQTTPEEFVPVLREAGLSFEKSLFFEKYVQLRELCGQDYKEAIEALFPIFIHNDYERILQFFQNELYIAQVKFHSHTEQSTENSEIEE